MPRCFLLAGEAMLGLLRARRTPVCHNVLGSPADEQTGQVQFRRSYVPGIIGGSFHLNDPYFAKFPFGPPIYVCHGVCGYGVVGPPNSFRFPYGPGQLEFYQNISATTASFFAGAGIAYGSLELAPVAANIAGGVPNAASKIWNYRLIEDTIAGVPFAWTTVGDLVLVVPQIPVYAAYFTAYGAYITYRLFPITTGVVLEGIVEGLDDLAGPNPVGWVVSALKDQVKDWLQ